MELTRRCLWILGELDERAVGLADVLLDVVLLAKTDALRDYLLEYALQARSCELVFELELLVRVEVLLGVVDLF